MRFLVLVRNVFYDANLYYAYVPDVPLHIYTGRQRGLGVRGFICTLFSLAKGVGVRGYVPSSPLKPRTIKVEISNEL